MKYLRLSILTLILAIALASLTSCNSYAVTYGNSGVYGWSANNSIFYEVGNYPLSNLSSNSLYSYVGTSTRLNGMSLRANSTIPASSLISFTITFCGSVYKGWSGSANQPVVENSLATRVWGQAYCYIETVYIYNRYATNTVATVYPYFMGDNSSSTPSEITVSPMTYVVLTSESSDAALGNIAGILSDMRTQNNDIWQMLNNINTNITNNVVPNLRSLKDSMDGVAEQEERVADVAEDEYNKTIQDEATASAGAGGFSFNFALPNPFGIFQVSDGCVSTPTIDSWLHLEGDWKSPHCPVIPASVRNVLTPVVTLIVTLATLLVVIRWVSSSAVDVAGNSVAMNDNPKGGK